ncbi:hypothetical protein AAFO92_22370 [Roseovarius sp. CAU 1744]|uniref:hypothetical protein n=1 Tax=Roseovarius sp. CAU 1744 TaxID=3140368 RepID=UPI00325B99EE
MTLLPGSYSSLIEEFVAERSLSMERAPPNVVIGEAVRKFPNAPALEAAFACICVASALEQPVTLSKEIDVDFIIGLYRAIAVFSADVYAVEKLYGPTPTCSRVLEFWVQTDERFFTVGLPKEVTKG